MKLNTGMNLSVDLDKMEFIYDVATTGPLTEKRRLDDIRASLSDPNAEGPSIVYAVAMDVAKDGCTHNPKNNQSPFQAGSHRLPLKYLAEYCPNKTYQWNAHQQNTRNVHYNSR